MSASDSSNVYMSANDATTPLYPKMSTPSQPQVQPQPQPSQPRAFTGTYAQQVPGSYQPAHYHASSQPYTTSVPSHQFYAYPNNYHHQGSVNIQYQSPEQKQWYAQEHENDQARESCCSRFWKGPFRARNYGLLLSNIFIQGPWAWLASMWVGAYFFLMFGGMAPMIVGMIFGPLVTLLVISSWEWLVNVEIRSHFYAGRDHPDIQEAKLRLRGQGSCSGVGDRLIKHKQDMKTWEGFWSSFKDMAWRWSAWKPAFYFLLLKPWVAFFSMLVSFITFFGGLALIFNFVLVATCQRCRDGHWGGHDRAHWVFGTYAGSSVTVPLGLFLIFLACFFGRGLAQASARLAAYIFLKKSVPSSSSSSNPNPNPNANQSNESASIPQPSPENSDMETPLVSSVVPPSHLTVQVQPTQS